MKTNLMVLDPLLHIPHRRLRRIRICVPKPSTLAPIFILAGKRAEEERAIRTNRGHVAQHLRAVNTDPVERRMREHVDIIPIRSRQLRQHVLATRHSIDIRMA